MIDAFCTVLVAPALQSVQTTVTVEVSRACPVSFDVEAYRTAVAADVGVSRDRVSVRVICRDKQPLPAPASDSEDGGAPHRSLQSEEAEVIIIVSIADLTATQAVAVSQYVRACATTVWFQTRGHVIRTNRRCRRRAPIHQSALGSRGRFLSSTPAWTRSAGVWSHVHSVRLLSRSNRDSVCVVWRRFHTCAHAVMH